MIALPRTPWYGLHIDLNLTRHSWWDFIFKAVRTFDEGDATEIIARTRRLANQIEDVTAMLISKKDAIPLSLHGAVAQGLQAIKSHAKGAGDALVNDCPVRS